MALFKIIAKENWDRAVAEGLFTGAAIDLADGYIHLSGETQVEETARLHFAGQDGLLLVAFSETQFGGALKWEASRGGALFPHVYGTIDPATALWAKPLLWNGTAHDFPENWRR